MPVPFSLSILNSLQLFLTTVSNIGKYVKSGRSMFFDSSLLCIYLNSRILKVKNLFRNPPFVIGSIKSYISLENLCVCSTLRGNSRSQILKICLSCKSHISCKFFRGKFAWIKSEETRIQTTSFGGNYYDV